jgi:hypothetical protein
MRNVQKVQHGLLKLFKNTRAPCRNDKNYITFCFVQGRTRAIFKSLDPQD